jgi:hypothetical protein
LETAPSFDEIFANLWFVPDFWAVGTVTDRFRCRRVPDKVLKRHGVVRRIEGGTILELTANAGAKERS